MNGSIKHPDIGARSAEFAQRWLHEGLIYKADLISQADRSIALHDLRPLKGRFPILALKQLPVPYLKVHQVLTVELSSFGNGHMGLDELLSSLLIIAPHVSPHE